MGSHWSQTRPGIAGESEELNQEGTEPSNDAEETTSDRKRRRSSEEEQNDDTSINEERPRKRRRASKVWNTFTDLVTSLVAKGFLVVAEWATCDPRRGELTDQEMMQGVLQLLDFFQGSNANILRRGWRVLCACNSTTSIAEGPSEEPILESDISTVISAMKKHSKSLRIQLLGCRALRALVLTNSSEEKWEGLCDAGAVQVFLQALRNFQESVVMQGLAMTFLAMVVREEGEMPRRQALADGAIQLILAAMRRFDDDPRLLHTSIYAISQLHKGTNRQSRDIILENGGIDVLLNSLRRHLGDVSLTDICLSVLSKLSDEENLAGRGAVPLILESMEKWSEHEGIQGHIVVLILRLVGQESIPTRRCIQLVLSAMRRFPRSASLQFFACATLREILQRTQGREALDITCAEGGIENVLNAVRNHRRCFGLQPMCLLFLLQIFEESQAGQHEAIAAFGGGDDVVALVAALRVEMDPELNVPVVEIR